MPHNMLDCVQRRQQHLLDLEQRQHQHHRQHLLIDRTCVDSSCSRAVRDRMRHRHSPTILSSASRTLERASFVISLLVFFFLLALCLCLPVCLRQHICVCHSFIHSSNHQIIRASLSHSLSSTSNQFLSAIIVSLIVIVISTSVILACIIIVIITIIIIIAYCLHYSCRRRRRCRCRCRRHHSVRCRSLHKQRLQQHVFISRCSSQGSDRLMYFSMSAATTRACLLQQRLRRVRHHDRDDASALRLSPIRHEVHRLE